MYNDNNIRQNEIIYRIDCMKKEPLTIKYNKNDFMPYSAHVIGRYREIASLLEHLAIMPMTAFHFNCSSEWRLSKRTLSNSYWSFITEGEGELLLGNYTSKVRAGQLILFPAGVEHSLTPVSNRCMSMINIHFQVRFYNLIDICGLLDLGGVYDDTGERFDGISSEIARLYRLKPPGWLSYFKSLIRVQLLDIILNSGKELRSVTPELEKLSRVYPALELVENSFTSPSLSTQDLAEKLNVSQVYTRKLFNKLFGVSPVKFIHNRRIEYACTLLRETELPVKGIALQSGFNDLAFFYRIFGRVMNLTPAQYRRLPQF